MSRKKQWTEIDDLPLCPIRTETINELTLSSSAAEYLHKIAPENSFSNDEFNVWIYYDPSSSYPAVREDHLKDETTVESNFITPDLCETGVQDVIE